MHPQYVIAGQLRREYLLPPEGRPVIDAPGGNLLYAASGAGVWEQGVGLVSRVGEDYPHEWLRQFAGRGFSSEGIRMIPEALELRSFRAYTDPLTSQTANPVSHFVRLGLPFPKSLLGYQPPASGADSRTHPAPDSPRITDVPQAYLEAKAVHLCPTDYVSHTQLFPLFRSAGAITITLDPSPGYMLPALLMQLKSLLRGLTAFIPSEEEMRALFWGRTDDLWAMIEEVGSWGVELVIVKRGGLGQWLYDSSRKRRFEIPAYPVRTVDPTGAGDAFCGGFLIGYAESFEALRGAMFGNVSASLAVEGSGAFFALDALPGLARARLDSLTELIREA
jgi:sugar/nucleoside kinase (ribokinase family)